MPRRPDRDPAPFDAGNERFRAGVRRFVSTELTPKVEAWERAGAFPKAALLACGRRGYLALPPGRSAILAEELVQCGSLGVALALFVQAGLVAPLIGQLGTDDQRKRLLPLLHGGRMVGAMAVTEPQAGSDIAAITATAELRHGRGAGQLVLEGEKTYITCAAAAGLLVVAARIVEDGKPDADPSLVLVPADTRGARIARLESLGLEVTAMGRVTLRGCRVPASAILGDRGGGYDYVLNALDRERLFGGIGAVAWASLALERTAAFLRQRRVFGRPVSRHQGVRHQLAECATALAAARQLNYAAYRRWAAGENAMGDIAMVKLFSYRQAQRAVELCLQLHGGLGYMTGHWTSRWYRDARALTIAAGTPEVMRDLVAAHLRL